MSELSKEVLTDHFGPWAAKLWVPKVKDHEKKSQKSHNLHLARFYIVNRCSSGDPGSIPGGRQLWAPTVSEPMDQT